MKLVIYNTNTW